MVVIFSLFCVVVPGVLAEGRAKVSIRRPAGNASQACSVNRGNVLDAQSAGQAEVNIFDSQRRGQAEHDNTLEQLTGGLVLAAAEDDEILL
jgi:hypothetical protein